MAHSPHTLFDSQGTDTAPIIASLTRLLAEYRGVGYGILYCHWNIKGPDFFDLHEQFEILYKEAIKQHDRIAERLAAYGVLAPIQSQVRTLPEKRDGREMASYVVEEVSYSIDVHRETLSLAKEIGDYGSIHFLEAHIYFLEQKRWMLQMFLSAS